MCGGDVALCQITLTTCSLRYRLQYKENMMEKFCRHEVLVVICVQMLPVINSAKRYNIAIDVAAFFALSRLILFSSKLLYCE